MKIKIIDPTKQEKIIQSEIEKIQIEIRDALHKCTRGKFITPALIHDCKMLMDKFIREQKISTCDIHTDGYNITVDAKIIQNQPPETFELYLRPTLVNPTE